LFMILISGFIIGGVLGAIVFTVMQFSALILPSILTALIAWLYWLYLHYVAKLER
jgi:hypothetical protein